MTKIIDGKSLGLDIQNNLRERIARHLDLGSRAPGLAVVLVGDDPASKIYVSHKERVCHSIGIKSQVFLLPKDTLQEKLLSLIDDLNMRSDIDGILVQLPLPDHLNRYEVIEAIDPSKDVDGLCSKNQGLLALNLKGFVPCTPYGVMELLKSIDCHLSGKRVVVIGRSVLVGGPLVKLLTHAHATVTNIHSKTKNPQNLCKEADVVVVAAGVHNLVDRNWIKQGAVVIDVGIHNIEGKLEGDVDFSSIEGVASFATPVPGGVGPMTIASLMVNCLQSYELKMSAK